jgi:hypothetical protein
VTLIYLYCLLPGEAQLGVEDIEGMEPGRPLELVAAGLLQAAVSEVGEEFSEATLNARIRDLDWLSPRAVRHHEVVDQLFARCRPLLPLSFGAIFQSKDSLKERLAPQQHELVARLDRLRGREEWDLKLSRDEAIFRGQLREESEPVRQLETELAAKPPGTRFLLEKKLENLQSREAQRVSASVRGEVHKALSARAVEAQRDPLSTPAQPQSIRLELRSAYLVEQQDAGTLKSTADALADKYAPLGYQLELSGPWPPFTFAGGVRETLE